MALINCPECNREISDKVKACPFCGYPFEQNIESEQIPQKVEVTSVNIKSGDPKKIKNIIYSAVGVIVVITIVFAIITINKTNKEKERYNTYIDNVDFIMNAMLLGASEAEEQVNLIAKVWRNAIYEERDPETDKFTLSDKFSFVDDFNTALNNLFEDSATITRNSAIETYQSVIQEKMKELQNPPEGLENSYNTLTDLYTSFKSLTDLAINPSGSLDSFSESKSDNIDNFKESYDRLITQIPDKK